MERVYIKTVDGKGRGVFAGENLPAGTVLEKSHTITFHPKEFQAIENTNVKNYYFIRDLPDGTEQGILVLGRTSLLNHSHKPNCKVSFADESGGPVAVLETLQPVRKDEEITIDYDTKLWFEYIDY